MNEQQERDDQPTGGHAHDADPVPAPTWAPSAAAGPPPAPSSDPGVPAGTAEQAATGVQATSGVPVTTAEQATSGVQVTTGVPAATGQKPERRVRLWVPIVSAASAALLAFGGGWALGAAGGSDQSGTDVQQQISSDGGMGSGQMGVPGDGSGQMPQMPPQGGYGEFGGGSGSGSGDSGSGSGSGGSDSGGSGDSGQNQETGESSI